MPVINSVCIPVSGDNGAVQSRHEGQDADASYSIYDSQIRADVGSPHEMDNGGLKRVPELRPGRWLAETPCAILGVYAKVPDIDRFAIWGDGCY